MTGAFRMVDVVLFHHVQGLTDGVLAFAAELRASGHTVHTPDLFDGRRPASVDDGFALVRAVGDDALRERAAQAVGELPARVRGRQLGGRDGAGAGPDPSRRAGRAAV